MSLATKNNALIIKDGKLAENCNCCGEWYCSAGACCDATSGETSMRHACDCDGQGKVFLGEWTTADLGCAPCGFWLPFNVTATITYSGPSPWPGYPGQLERSSTLTYNPWTCNGSLFTDITRDYKQAFSVVWVPLGQASAQGVETATPSFSYFSFNYSRLADGSYRQSVLLIDGLRFSNVASQFHTIIPHECNQGEKPWDWINNLHFSYSSVYYGLQLLPGAVATVTIHGFDSLKFVGRDSSTPSWVTRCL